MIVGGRRDGLSGSIRVMIAGEKGVRRVHVRIFEPMIWMALEHPRL